MKLKIFLLTASPHGIGTFVRARELARILNKKGHYVVLGYCGTQKFLPKKEIVDGVIEIAFPNFLHRLNLDSFASPVAKFFINLQLRESKFDVVHGFEHFSAVHYAGVKSRKKYNSVYISDWADWFSEASGRKLYKVPGFRKYIRALERRAKTSPDGITAISKILYDEAKNLRSSKSDLLYLPGGSPVDRLVPLDISKCKQNLNISKDVTVFGYMGSWLTEELIPFLKAVEVIINKHKVKVLILGKYSDKVFNFVQEANLSEKVIFTGYLEEKHINGYLCACDAFLIPLKNNIYNKSRWPNKIGDYLACGRPVIASNVGELTSAFKSSDIGFFVSDDIDDIKEKMLKIIAITDIQHEENSIKFRNLAKSISWENRAEVLLSFYLQKLEKIKTK